MMALLFEACSELYKHILFITNESCFHWIIRRYVEL